MNSVPHGLRISAFVPRIRLGDCLRAYPVKECSQ